MDEELSIISDKNRINLDTNKSDVAAMFIKGIFGAAPYAGSLLAELFVTVIPNQKQDRVIRFLKVLDYKFSYIEKDVLELKMKGEEFSELLEEGVIQASRASTDERREHLASLLKNSITDDELEQVGKKKLLYLLNELNDAEIILLRYHGLYPEGQRELAQQHEALFKPTPVGFGSPEKDINQKAIKDSYRSRLADLGLIKARYKMPKKGEMPEFDEKTGVLKSSSWSTTPLGNLLLKYLDLDSQTIHESKYGVK